MQLHRRLILLGVVAAALAVGTVASASSPEVQVRKAYLPGLSYEPASSPTVTANPGPRSLPLAIPVRSAEELRADLRKTLTLSDTAQLTPTDFVTMSRLYAIDDMLEKITDYYGTDYLWSLAMMMAESSLDPTAKGPLVDDRGLGQIGYHVEEIARTWGTDPDNPYYSPSLDGTASIWNPNVQLHAEAIWFRNILTFDFLTSIDQTYALYTKGLAAVDPETGVISERAQVDVKRARSHVPRLEKLLFLKDSVRRDGAVPATLPRIARQILEIDRSTADGAAAYAAYRDMYAALVEGGLTSPFDIAAYLHEAISYADLLDRGYGLDQTDAFRRLQVLVDRSRAAVSRQSALVPDFNHDAGTVAAYLAAH